MRYETAKAEVIRFSENWFMINSSSCGNYQRRDDGYCICQPYTDKNLHCAVYVEGSSCITFQLDSLRWDNFSGCDSYNGSVCLGYNYSGGHCAQHSVTCPLF